ncbi:hypothetical protein MMYC01_209227 [Madurella mycetomatis]|uniref:Uncharacterized protein n=1 Tax=Madurella mycetomatis TaxID=100816 RepID=A0A175VTN8_9PEZI|nr:hypothetical protein MMYC01_209227 [Madurella mycetomatis]
MALRLLFTLALAHRAAALLDGYVVKVTKVEHIQLASNLFADVVGAAIDEDDGLRACATADAVINSCYSAGALETDAPIAEFENCMCCQSNTPISSAYGDCAEYISSSVSGSDASTVLEAVSILWGVCSDAGRGVCAGGFATQTQPAASTRTRGSSSDVTAPAGCTSMMAIYSSCSEEIDFQTARLGEVAECFCQDRSGSFDTRFEDYASSCAPFARTAVPEDYEVISAFQTICDDAPPTSTSVLQFSSVSSRNPGAADLPGFNVPTETDSDTSSPAATDPPAAGGENTSTGLAAPGAMTPGFLTWVANLATFFLSFFILI